MAGRGVGGGGAVQGRSLRCVYVATLEVTQGQILSQSPTDATRFRWHVYVSLPEKPSICPWVASRVVCINRQSLGVLAGRGVGDGAAAQGRSRVRVCVCVLCALIKGCPQDVQVLSLNRPESQLTDPPGHLWRDEWTTLSGLLSLLAGCSVGGGAAAQGRSLLSSSSSSVFSSLELSDTKVCEAEIRALLRAASKFCEVVVPESRTCVCVSCLHE